MGPFMVVCCEENGALRKLFRNKNENAWTFDTWTYTALYTTLPAVSILSTVLFTQKPTYGWWTKSCTTWNRSVKLPSCSLFNIGGRIQIEREKKKLNALNPAPPDHIPKTTLNMQRGSPLIFEVNRFHIEVQDFVHQQYGLNKRQPWFHKKTHKQDVKSTSPCTCIASYQAQTRAYPCHYSSWHPKTNKKQGQPILCQAAWLNVAPFMAGGGEGNWAYVVPQQQWEHLNHTTCGFDLVHPPLYTYVATYGLNKRQHKATQPRFNNKRHQLNKNYKSLCACIESYQAQTCAYICHSSSWHPTANKKQLQPILCQAAWFHVDAFIPICEGNEALRTLCSKNNGDT